jgi:putative ABC transport system permease protein
VARHLTRIGSVGQLTTILASALVVCAISLSIADAAWLRPYLYPAASEIFSVRLLDQHSGRSLTRIPRALWAEWLSGTHGISLSAYQLDVGEVDLGSGPRGTALVRMSAGTLTMLGYRPAAGRDIAASDDPAGVALLSYGTWERVFSSSSDIAGTVIRIDNVPLTIVGVAPREFQLPLIPFSPVAYLALPPPSPEIMDLDAGQLTVIGRARNFGAVGDALSAGMGEYQQALLAKTGRRVMVRAVPIGHLAAQDSRPWALLVVLVSAIVLMAWSTVAHFVFVHCHANERAWGIRIALGASRAAVVRGVIATLGIVVLFSLLVALCVTHIVLNHYATAIQSALSLPRQPGITMSMLVPLGTVAFVLAIGLAVVVTSIAARRSLPETLRDAEHGRRPVGRMRIQRILLGSQMLCAGSLVAVASVAAGLFVKLSETIGLDPSNVVSTSFAPRTPAGDGAGPLFADVDRRLSRVIGVEVVSLVDLLPFHNIAPSRELVQIPDRAQPVRVSVRRVDAAYFDVLRIDVVEGRRFAPTDMVSPPAVALVSQGLARRYWGGVGSLGRTIRVGDRPPLTIVGVAADVRDFQLDHPAEPTVYVPLSDRHAGRYDVNRGILIRASAGNTGAVARSVREIMEELTPVGTHIAVSTMESRMGRSYIAPQLYAWATGVCAWFALLLAGFGTYAVCLHVVNQQRYTICVRMMCGARRSDIIMHVARYGAWPIAIGLGLGVVAGVLASHSLVRMVYADAALGVVPTIASIGLLVLVSAVALLRPAVLATVQDPLALFKA